MLAVNIQDPSKKYFLTPIGPVPMDFTFMTDLLKQAHIGFRDVTVFDEVEDGQRPQLNSDGTATIVPKKKKVPRVIRDWHIIQDKELVMAHRLNTAGKYVRDEKRKVTACNEHMKFCMIVDYVRHTIERSEKQLNLDVILLIAIGKKSVYETALGGQIEFGENVEKMRRMHWRNLNNHLADLGVHGYKAVSDPDVFSSL
jgi:hypothetical protein